MNPKYIGAEWMGSGVVLAGSTIGFVFVDRGEGDKMGAAVHE